VIPAENGAEPGGVISGLPRKMKYLTGMKKAGNKPAFACDNS